MKPSLSEYSGLKICVAVSGGKDSIALLHYLYMHAYEFSVTLSALNCDHGMRGKESESDSAFVKKYCSDLGVPCKFYEWKGAHGADEQSARQWRLSCYRDAVNSDGNGWKGADVIATAHHMNDNAETVLFNISRGSSLAGVTGIKDTVADGVRIIRPLINCSREEIDEYITENGLPFVNDSTNETEAYTRNKIRRTVLPALERCVPCAVGSIYRFSRLAAIDEEFIRGEMLKREIVSFTDGDAFVKFTEERALFYRAAVEAVRSFFGRKDYTFTHVETLFNLQYFDNGKRTEFLGLTAFKERDGIRITENAVGVSEELPFGLGEFEFGGETYAVCKDMPVTEYKTLVLDLVAVPSGAVIRTARVGDKFTKFGGGTKNLGDFFTDKKIPLSERKKIPLIAVGSVIYAVFGVEISDSVKITANSKNVAYIARKK